MPELPDVLHAFIAAEDLSDSQFRIVKFAGYDSARNSPTVALCDTAGEKMCGVLQDNPEAGEVATVMREGKSLVVLGEELAIGRSWTTDANGAAVGADGDEWVGGMAQEPGSLSPTPTGEELGSLDVQCLSPWITPSGFSE